MILDPSAEVELKLGKSAEEVERRRRVGRHFELVGRRCQVDVRDWRWARMTENVDLEKTNENHLRLKKNHSKTEVEAHW